MLLDPNKIDKPFPWFGLPFWHSVEGNSLQEFLEEEELQGKIVYPERGVRLAPFKYTPFNKTKVVIFGDRPIPFPEVNTGLAYAVPDWMPTPNIPQKTQNIFSELEAENITPPKSMNLIGWARQGVLLVNRNITTVRGDHGAHDELWYSLMVEVVHALMSTEGPPVVFMLWGEENVKFYEHSVPSAKNWKRAALPLMADYPSNKSFIGCNHFTLCNRFFHRKGLPLIYWSR